MEQIIIDPSGKKVALIAENRQRYYENHEVLTGIKAKISERVQREFEKEAGDIKAENDRLFSNEKRFSQLAKKMLSSCTTETKLKISTQVGKNGSVVHEYTGTLQRRVTERDGTFNFIDPNAFNGGPFTVGYSCLLSVEVLD